VLVLGTDFQLPFHGLLEFANLRHHAFVYGDRDSHPTLLLLLPGFSSLRGPHLFTEMLLPTQSASLLDHLAVLRGIGNRLSPVNFRGPGSRLVSCYALFKG